MTNRYVLPWKNTFTSSSERLIADGMQHASHLAIPCHPLYAQMKQKVIQNSVRKTPVANTANVSSAVPPIRRTLSAGNRDEKRKCIRHRYECATYYATFHVHFLWQSKKEAYFVTGRTTTPLCRGISKSI